MSLLTTPVVHHYTPYVKDIAYSRSAVRTLTRMPRNVAGRIREKVREYADDPAVQSNNVTRLRGQVGLLRLRTGDWRVIMRDGEVIEVLYVASRGSAYKE